MLSATAISSFLRPTKSKAGLARRRMDLPALVFRVLHPPEAVGCRRHSPPRPRSLSRCVPSRLPGCPRSDCAPDPLGSPNRLRRCAKENECDGQIRLSHDPRRDSATRHGPKPSVGMCGGPGRRKASVRPSGAVSLQATLSNCSAAFSKRVTSFIQTKCQQTSYIPPSKVDPSCVPPARPG